MQKCSKCGNEYNENLFMSGKDVCILCQRKNRPQRSEASMEQRRQAERLRQKNDIKYSLMKAARKRAKAKGLEFTITKNDIELPEFCPILGVKLEKHDGRMGKNSYSLDRIDNSKGYIPGNVCVISLWANITKERLTVEQAERLLAYMKKQQGV